MSIEEKQEEADGPKYRDRAKECREDQNPDYEATELGSFHAVAPPGTVDIRATDAHKLSIEKSKYLGGDVDVEPTHLVKGGPTHVKSHSNCKVKPQTINKSNEMFLPGRMAFIFNMEGGYSNEIPTTLHGSKADCPVPEVYTFSIPFWHLFFNGGKLV
ncbi:hypothetical protein CMV_004817 [Castanea mollissima]|uniref:RED-like N-terminal domain-containing protein n=1 Tax=Castanea mollissima TaxID=60419 RepID=A0A8J4RER7_9ROSI|nr:hypothetical protein CMV_004817 [Castanea mollissima]